MAFSNEVVLAAWRRAGGRCECGQSNCGHGPWRCSKVLNWNARGNDYSYGGWEAHHKIPVLLGGPDTLDKFSAFHAIRTLRLLADINKNGAEYSPLHHLTQEV